MADIAAADVTYAEVAGSAKHDAAMRRSAVFTVTFGDGALTYPTGGIPLTKGKLGCPVNIDELIVMDKAASGYEVAFDLANGKIRLFNPLAAHAHDFKVIGGTAAAGTDALNIKTAIVGKEAATNATALGVDSATKGGVLASTAAVGSELGNVAVAATTLKIKVVGY